MINLKKFISVIIILVSINSFAQTLDWSYSIGGSKSDKCHDIEIDKYGNIYLTGQFRNTVDFDLTENVFELSSTGYNISNVFLSRYNSDQELNFAISLSCETYSTASMLELDYLGNSYISGNYIGSMDFDPSNNDYILTSEEQIYFLAKYDSIGSFQWAKNISQNSISEMHSDTLGNVYISTNDSIMKINSGGNKEWSIKTSNRISNPTFDNLSSFYYLSSETSEHVFLNKLDTSGIIISTKEIISMNNGTVTGKIQYDKSGNLIIAGNIWGHGNYNSDITDDISILNNEMSTCSSPEGDYPCPVYHRYISKFDTLGNIQWAFDFYSNGPNASYIKTKNDGTIYIFGELTHGASIDFNHTNDTALLHESLGEYYIAKYDVSCNFLGATKFLGGSYNDCLSGVKFYDDTTVYMCGYYFNTIELGLDGTSHQLHCDPSEDFFIAKYSSFTINDFTETNYKVPHIIQSDNIEIFPNPTHNTLFINYPIEGLMNISIYNLNGQEVFKTSKCYNNSIKVDHLENGIYIIEVRTSNEIFRKKIIKT